MAQLNVKSNGCGFDHHSRKLNIYLNLYFHFTTECFNTRFPLPSLLCVGYSVKLRLTSISFLLLLYYSRPVAAQWHKRATLRKLNILYFHFLALVSNVASSFTIYHRTATEVSQWECLNTRSSVSPYIPS